MQYNPRHDVMKPHLTRNFFKVCLATLAVGLMAFAGLNTQAAVIVGLSYPSSGGGENDIFTMDSSAPGLIQQSHPLSGLQANETLRGIDFFNGTIFGLGSGGNLYTVNHNTGAATFVGNFGLVLNGAVFGVDNSPNGFNVVSELRQNLVVNRATGVATVLPTLTPTAAYVSSLAYSQGTMFAIDSVANVLGTLNTGTGLFSTIGPLGIDVARNNGFDIDGQGIAWLASGATSSDPQANLYTVNLATGMVTLVGQVGQPGDNTLVRGLTVIPEPGTASLVLVGLAALAIRRRR
jgi:hypothetical protein